MSMTAVDQVIPKGPGAVSGAPSLPEGFTDTFTSRYVDAGDLRQHAVIGGEGPPLLLVHGWPQTWYQYRLVMPALARDFEVIAVDQRGIGLSDKPPDGYDIGTLAADMVALMDSLGHQRFALVGFDTGMFISYALAADHPDRLDRLVVGEAFIPGVCPSPPLFVPGPINERLWHLAFNRLAMVNEDLVRGREDIFFGAEYAAWAGTPLPEEVVKYYIDRHRLRPRSPAWQLRAVSGARHRLCAERGAQDAAADPARPRDRRIRKRGRPVRERHEARRGRRAERRHTRVRALARRGGTRRVPGRADRVPRPVPRPRRSGPRRRAACSGGPVAKLR